MNAMSGSLAIAALVLVQIVLSTHFSLCFIKPTETGLPTPTTTATKTTDFRKLRRTSSGAELVLATHSHTTASRNNNNNGRAPSFAATPAASIRIAVQTTVDHLSSQAAASAQTWALAAERRYGIEVQYYIVLDKDEANDFTDSSSSSSSSSAVPAASAIDAENDEPSSFYWTERAKAFGVQNVRTVQRTSKTNEALPFEKQIMEALAYDPKDWTFLVNDEAYVHVDHLLSLLADKDQNDSIYLGVLDKNNENTENTRTVCSQEYGWILSRPAMLNLAGHLRNCDETCVKKGLPLLCSQDAAYIVTLHREQDSSSFPIEADTQNLPVLTINVQQPSTMKELHYQFFVPEHDPTVAPWKVNYMPQVHAFDEVDANVNRYGEVNFWNETRLRNLLKSPQYFGNEEFEIKRCLTCDVFNEFWFAAVSTSASSKQMSQPSSPPANTLTTTTSVVGRVHRSGHPSRYTERSDHIYRQMDFIVPYFGGSQARLSQLVYSLSETTNKVNAAPPNGIKVKFRLLVTKHPNQDEWLVDHSSNETDVGKLQAQARSGGIQFAIVPCAAKTFNRAKAVNALLRSACHNSDCLVAMVDVDMYIAPSFIIHSMAFVHPLSTAYVPIDYTGNNPETIELVNKVVQNDPMMLDLHGYHQVDFYGHWKWYAYGQITLSGPDAAAFRMQEDFEGWGGEDVAFFETLARYLNIVRMRERGLFHVWHRKDCKVGSFVKEDQLSACQSSVDRVEGSILGVYLKKQAEKERLLFKKG